MVWDKGSSVASLHTSHGGVRVPSSSSRMTIPHNHFVFHRAKSAKTVNQIMKIERFMVTYAIVHKSTAKKCQDLFRSFAFWNVFLISGSFLTNQYIVQMYLFFLNQ